MSEPNWCPGMTLEQLEKLVILKAYKFYGANQTKTAEALGITARTLYSKLIIYGVKEVESGQSGLGGEETPKQEQSKKDGLQVAAGAHLEPSLKISAQSPLPVRKREEIQILPSRSTGNGTSKSR